MYRIKPTDIVSKSNVKADVNREDKISSFITYKHVRDDVNNFIDENV